MEDRANYSVGAPIDRTAGFHSGAVDVNLEELFRKLRRRIWLILAIIAAATLLTAAVSLLLPTRYTA
ncbi:MAG TPA: Wzz/FepE/Etk N-terminal domain-containing protein, partial [Rhodospirillales bacterium]|nr:Wzz/FepE/Etk N-terminal domain-containing protein [Rhodospirillales bacterium]